MSLDELFRSIREHTQAAQDDLSEIPLPIVNTDVERKQVARALAELKAATFAAERFLVRL